MSSPYAKLVATLRLYSEWMWYTKSLHVVYMWLHSVLKCWGGRYKS